MLAITTIFCRLLTLDNSHNHDASLRFYRQSIDIIYTRFTFGEKEHLSMIGKRKSRRVSMELSKVVLLGLVFCAVAVEGQTTVTTSGGTTNTVPLFTGSSTLGQSPISFSSGSMVVAGTAGSSIGTFLNQGGTNAVGGLLLQTPTSSNTGTNELFEWYFNEDSVHVLSRSLSLFQYPSDSLGGFMHQHAAFGITSTGSSYQYFSGNVGIGTTTPGATLEVNGNVH